MIIKKIINLMRSSARVKPSKSWNRVFGYKPTALIYLLIVAIVIPLALGGNTNLVNAASVDWNMTTAGDYTYDNTKIDVAGGTASLKKSVPFAATGGVVTTDGDYTVHTFSDGGTFTANGSANVEYLVVAGGGGGGSGNGGGGAAGGYRSSIGTSGGGAAVETALAVTAQAYTITVGGGGTGGTPDSNGVNGANSSIATNIVSLGGGGGGGWNTNGVIGGSGGGSGSYLSGSFTGGLGTTNQGYKGGDSSTYCYGAGGGGASAVGADAGATGGNGGGGLNGIAGGGGGGVYSGTAGNGTNGGGNGGVGGGVAGSAGTANTGGGGGGGGGTSGGIGGNGGSGIVIVRYLTSSLTYPTPATDEGTGGIITHDGDYTVHTFTSDGTFTPSSGLTSVETLVVAGGGGGGHGVDQADNGGGGGAGGVIYNPALNISSQAYAVTVASSVSQDTNGQNSVFSTLTATGGGKGGAQSVGANGGSGGGGSSVSNRAGGSASPADQGNNGGTGARSGVNGGGGGGGAGAVGASGVTGVGGAGTSTYSSLLIAANAGVDVGGTRYIAAGGSAGNDSLHLAGGTGGGGSGAVYTDSSGGGAGTANTGGGGGGGASRPANAAGGTGGSGIVIVRYLTPPAPVGSLNLTPASGQGYLGVSGFTETLGAGSAGSIKYQLSPNNGTTWYYHNGSAWTATTVGYTEANTAAEVNTHFADNSFNSVGTAPKQLKWRAYFISDGSQQPILDNLSLTYIWDTLAPPNPTITPTSQKTGGTALTDNTYYKHPNINFAWAASVDVANEGEGVSGTAGYYIYFGTSNSATPKTTRGIASELGGTGIHYQSATGFEVGVDSAAMTPGDTYYLRLQTIDNGANTAAAQTLFTYKYDTTAPTSPGYVSASPSSYTRTNQFTFSWPVSGGQAGQDTGGSGLAGYQYRINSGSWSTTITGDSVALTDAATTGLNIFYFRAIDNAGNYDDSPVQTNFYFNASAPTAPTNLAVNPATPSDNNAFSFSWGLPITNNGSIVGYYYSINALPTLANTTLVSTTSLGEDAYATQQGQNTLYLVAKDEAGNYDFDSCSNITGNPNIDGCAKVNFTANTAAPGIPTAVQIFDISNRDTQEFATTLKWTEPANKGAGFDGYTIYRSSDGSSFSQIGTTSGTTYADTGLLSQKYYYYVKSRDNAGQYSPTSSTVSTTPSGRYTTAPVLTEGPAEDVKVFSVTATWRTDRVASSFIEYGTESNKLGEDHGGKTVGKLDSGEAHSVKVEGLQPETLYYYQAVWVDSDGNQGRSEIKNFTTGIRPKVTNAKVSNIGLSSALITYSTTSSTHTEVHYGKTTSYGGSMSENSGSQTTNHSIQLSDLDHSSTYHYTIVGTDIEDNPLDIGTDFVFDTLPMPLVSALKFESVKDAAMTTLKIVWKTNVATTSQVVYKPQTGGDEKQENKGDLTMDHEVSISNLNDSTTYNFVAKGRDQFGNETVSDTNSFTTPIDTRPPVISDLTIETSNVGTGRQDKSQIAISWKTDEPATSQVEYGDGISGDSYTGTSIEDKVMNNTHLVIISDLEPNKAYHLRASSADKGNNVTKSDDQIAIAGSVPRSVLQTLLQTLTSIFGWMNFLGK